MSRGLGSSDARSAPRTRRYACIAVGLADIRTTGMSFSVGFSMEGNVYITKLKGDGNITVKVKVNGRSQ